MTTVVAVGAQWGDEGKGKIVDWLGPARSQETAAEQAAAVRMNPRRVTYFLMTSSLLFLMQSS